MFYAVGFLKDESKFSELEEVLCLLPSPDVKCLAQSFQLVKDKDGRRLNCKEDNVMALLNHSKRQQSLIFTKGASSNQMKNIIMKR